MARLGRIEFKISYVVDLENENMVDEARQCVYEDVMNAVKYDEVAENIDVVEDTTATTEDIPEFLLGPNEDEDSDYT
jgi:hypothetical protein